MSNMLAWLPVEIREKIFGYILHEDVDETYAIYKELELEPNALFRQVNELNLEAEKILLASLVDEGKRLAEIESRIRRPKSYYDLFKRTKEVKVIWNTKTDNVEIIIPRRVLGSGVSTCVIDDKKYDLRWEAEFSIIFTSKDTCRFTWKDFRLFQEVLDLWLGEKGVAKDELLRERRVELLF